MLLNRETAVIDARQVYFVAAELMLSPGLVEGLPAGGEIVAIDADADGISQMAAWAAGRSGYEAIHVLCHGRPGALEMGNGLIDAAAIATQGEALAQLGAALAEGGDILLYGCETGAGATGLAFVTALAGAARAGVVASSTLVGAAGLGGNWELDVAVGAIGKRGLVLEGFAGVLANDAPVVGNLNGDSVSYYEGGAAALLDAASNATVSDVDSADFDGGSLTVAITSNGVSGEDLLYVRREGTGAGQVNTSGNVVQFGGVGIGTFTGGSDGQNLVIAFNANATPAAVEALLRALVYSNSNSAEPSTASRTVTVTLNDGDSASVSTSTITVQVNGVNDAPTLTATGGTPTFTEGGSTVDLFSGVSINTVESGQTISSLSLTVSGVGNSNSEYLRIDGTTILLLNGNAGTTTTNGISYSVSLSAGVFTIWMSKSGGISTTAAQTLVDGMTYGNTSEMPTEGDRIIAITSIGDSGGTANGGVNTTALNVTATVHVEGVNDAPTIIAPSYIAGTEDTSSALTGISFSDEDAGSNSVTVTFGVPSGALSAITGAGVAVSGSGGQTLTLTGTLADINAFIAASGVSFMPGHNHTANVTLTIGINDGGHSGSGGALTATTTLPLTITAVNDAPVNTVPGSQVVAEDTALVFSTGNGNAISVSDVDAGINVLSVTLTAANGAITLAGTVGLSFTVGSGSGDTALSFTGTIADINNALNGLTFTPNAGYNGPASIQIVTNDQGASGTGGSATDTDTIGITVSQVNDAPSVTQGFSAIYYTESLVNAGPNILLETVTAVTDPEGIEAGGSLVISGLVDGDRLSIYNQGNGAGQIGFNAATGAVSLAGVQFGTAGMENGRFVVEFGAGVSNAAVLALLNMLTYQSVSDTPVAMHALTFVLNDGIEDGPAWSLDIGITAENDAPGFQNLNGAPVYTLTKAAVVLDSDVEIFDPELSNDPDANGAFAGAVLTLQRHGGANGDDVFTVGNGFSVWNGELLNMEGDRIGTVTNSGGVLQVTFTGPSPIQVTGSLVNAFLQGVSYSNTGTATGNVTIDYLFDDGNTGGQGTGGALTATGSVTVKLLPPNLAPTLSLSNKLTTLSENASVSSARKVADIVVHDDGEGTNVLSLSGADASMFQIVGTQLRLKAGVKLDFETNKVLDVNVLVNDTTVGGTPDDMVAFRLTLTDFNEAPSLKLTQTVKTLAEDVSTKSARTVATIAISDDALGTNKLKLSGADAGLFVISGNKLMLKAGAKLDFETNKVLDVSVSVDDPSIGTGVEATKAIKIAITDVVERYIGTTGNNVMKGSAAHEYFDGGTGRDVIDGGGGNDTLVGGVGVDRLTGGSGSDTFVFKSIQDSAPGISGYVNNNGLGPASGLGKRDIITDFTVGTDKIDVSGIDANTKVKGDQSFSWRGDGNFTGQAGQLLYKIYNAAGTANDKTIVYGDVDGDRKADFQIELTGLKVLGSVDFIL